MKRDSNNTVESPVPQEPVEVDQDQDALQTLEELWSEGVHDLDMPMTDFPSSFASLAPVVHTHFKPKSIFHPHWAKGKFIPTFYDSLL